MDDSLQGYAEKACIFWGGYIEPPKLIKHRENAVFDVTLRGNVRVALRLHRPGYKKQEEIESELWWTNALAEQGFPVPVPVQNVDGNYLSEISPEFIATVIKWVNGKPIGTADANQFKISKKIDFELGKVIGNLHNITEDLSFPDWFSRPSWGIEGLLGEYPNWGKFWEGEHLRSQEKEIFTIARDRAYSLLKQYEKEGAKTLLIHADVIGENVFQNDSGISLIDFDDCGYGFPIYDLATATIQSLEDINYQRRCNLILEGYDKVRSLKQIDTDLFPIFAMLRVLATSAWIVPRVSTNDPKIQIYKDRAITQAVEFLEK